MGQPRAKRLRGAAWTQAPLGERLTEVGLPRSFVQPRKRSGLVSVASRGLPCRREPSAASAALISARRPDPKRAAYSVTTLSRHDHAPRGARRRRRRRCGGGTARAPGRRDPALHDREPGDGPTRRDGGPTFEMRACLVRAASSGRVHEHAVRSRAGVFTNMLSSSRAGASVRRVRFFARDVREVSSRAGPVRQSPVVRELPLHVSILRCRLRVASVGRDLPRDRRSARRPIGEDALLRRVRRRLAGASVLR